MTYFKIYDYVKQAEPKDFRAAPYDLNYDILGLHKKRDWNKGQINFIEYYGSYDPSTNTFDDLVVKEYRTYYRVNEMLHRRELHIDWYLSDGTIGAHKNNIWKYYTPAESLKAGETRRRNVISNLKINCIGIIMAAYSMNQLDAEKEGWKFLNDYTLEIAQFIEGSQDQLKSVIEDPSTHAIHPWMGAPINPDPLTYAWQFLYNEINIDYTENNIYQ